ncbi:hypothetical protein, partial [Anaerotignum faecicola]
GEFQSLDYRHLYTEICSGRMGGWANQNYFIGIYPVKNPVNPNLYLPIRPSVLLSLQEKLFFL